MAQRSTRPGSAGSKTAWNDFELDGGDSESVSEPRKPAVSTMAAPVISVKDEKPTSRCERFLACFRPHQEEMANDNDLHIRATLRECAFYLIFMILIGIVSFGMTNTTFYNYTKVMKNLFAESPNTGSTQTTFETIGSMNDFWDYIGSSTDDKGELVQNAFQTGLYAWETWYNGAPADQPGFVYNVNKLLGVPRIRQVRVRNDSCIVPASFKGDIAVCHDDYSSKSVETRQFGNISATTWLTNSTAWKYSKDCNASGYGGLMASYDGSGYYVDLSRDAQVTADIINELKANTWIDAGTRAVFVDLTVYNANINLFSVIKLVVEFPPTGGAFTSSVFRTVKLLRYVSPFDYFVAACECFFLLFLVYYTLEEGIEIYRYGLTYFKSLWNLLDSIVVVLGYVITGVSFYRLAKVDTLLDELLLHPDSYANFDVMAGWQVSFNNLVAVMVFMVWIKIFKFISFNKTMTQLGQTLGGCAKDLFSFAIMFFILFLAFAQLGYLMFGTQVESYSTFIDSLFTLFRIILGDFDFTGLQQASPFLGPLYFILYVFFVFFVLLNMFLAIINDTYADIKETTANDPPEFELGDFMKKRYNKMLDKLNLRKDHIVDIQQALNKSDANSDKTVDYEEWRRELKGRGYAENEIEALFSRFDNDGDRCLNADEQMKMLKDLDQQKAEIDGEIREEEKVPSGSSAGRKGGVGGVPSDEFTALQRRVDRMEETIGTIVSKIDAVLNKLDGMDAKRTKRRETMSKMLDSIRESDASEQQKRQRVEELIRQELDKWDKELEIGALNNNNMSSGGNGKVARGGKF